MKQRKYTPLLGLNYYVTRKKKYISFLLSLVKACHVMGSLGGGRFISRIGCPESRNFRDNLRPLQIQRPTFGPKEVSGRMAPAKFITRIRYPWGRYYRDALQALQIHKPTSDSQKSRRSGEGVWGPPNLHRV